MTCTQNLSTSKSIPSGSILMCIISHGSIMYSRLDSRLYAHPSFYFSARSSTGKGRLLADDKRQMSRVCMCTNVSEHMRNRVKRAAVLHLLYSLTRADELRAGKITDICLKEKEKKMHCHNTAHHNTDALFCLCAAFL